MPDKRKVIAENQILTPVVLSQRFVFHITVFLRELARYQHSVEYVLSMITPLRPFLVYQGR